jgi:hypothetical protein
MEDRDAPTHISAQAVRKTNFQGDWGASRLRKEKEKMLGQKMN